MHKNKTTFFFNRPRSLFALLFFDVIFIFALAVTRFKVPQNKYAVIFILAATVFFTFRHFNTRLEISAEGLACVKVLQAKRYFMPWSDVASVGVTKSLQDKPVLFEYLYFSSDKKDEYFDITTAKQTPRLFIIICRRRAMKCVLMYWRKKIINYQKQ